MNVCAYVKDIFEQMLMKFWDTQFGIHNFEYLRYF